jgi:hypothetical protein
MISLAKRLEFVIKKCIDTPLKMFKILKTFSRNSGRELLNDDLKQDDINKIMRFVSTLTGNSSNVVEFHLLSVNFNEFIHVV